jgi:hypothetical protein
MILTNKTSGGGASGNDILPESLPLPGTLVCSGRGLEVVTGQALVRGEVGNKEKPGLLGGLLQDSAWEGNKPHWFSAFCCSQLQFLMMESHICQEWFECLL